jgi:hypothetical protein
MDVNHVVCKYIYEIVMPHLISSFNMYHYYCFELYN